MFKFWVSDTGAGIAADELPALFELFTQAEGYMTRKYEGSGLGLAICRRLVELMGGRIWAESTPGQGSIFYFTAMLEIRRELPEAVVASRAQEPTDLPIQRLAGRRVLVVEDSQLNRVVAVALLEKAGLIADTAENGRVAVDKVTGSGSSYYHAVLMDIQMPVMDGYEATRRIRVWESKVQDESTDNRQLTTDHRSPITGRRIPIIALTAHALKGEKEKCMAADMDDYLAKPLSELELHRVLLTWIAAEQEEVDTSNQLQAGGTSDYRTVLDVQGALKRLGGRRQIYVQVLKKFAPEYGKAHEIIRRHLSVNDKEAASRMAHSVKGAAAAIGAVRLSPVAAKLETALENEGPDIGVLLSGFKSELEQALEAIDRFLKAESPN